MKPLFIAASVFVTALTFAAVPAMAADNAAACRILSGQTNSAISNASGDVAQAREEARAGQAACQFGMWKSGADHYRKALSLLGK